METLSQSRTYNGGNGGKVSKKNGTNESHRQRKRQGLNHIENFGRSALLLLKRSQNVLTNEGRKRRRISGPVPNTSLKKTDNAIRSNTILVVLMTGTHGVVKFNHELRKNGRRENMLRGITRTGKDHRVPAVSTARHTPSTQNSPTESLNDYIAIRKDVPSVVATH